MNWKCIDIYELISNIHRSIQPKYRLLTSPLHPGEGKTTTSSNLAIVSANQFSKVLLVDCDMRKPQIHKKFNISNRFGLSNVLAQEDLNIPDTFFQKFKDKKGEGVVYITCRYQGPPSGTIIQR